jgi:N-acetylglucosamine kinase-like BadF-type ATPase
MAAGMMLPMPYFVALDSGGTSTECVLADGERILARARGKSIKVIRVTHEEARDTLRALLDEVAQQARVSLNQISVTCVGTAGISVPPIADWLRASFKELVSGDLILCGDDEIALDAAFPGQSGVLIIAGTGSNIVARTSTGQKVNVGGWGPILGDEGSGYWIGIQALRYALHARDRDEPARILDRVAAHWNLGGLSGTLERVYSTPPPDFAALAPLVSACAEEGDAVCFDVLAEAGQQLAAAAVLAFRKMRSLETNRGTLAGVAFTGSVLRSAAMVREHMIENIRRHLPAIQIVPEAVDPVLGALWRARSAHL